MVLVYVYYYGCYVSLMLERNVAVNGSGLSAFISVKETDSNIVLAVHYSSVFSFERKADGQDEWYPAISSVICRVSIPLQIPRSSLLFREASSKTLR